MKRSKFHASGFSLIEVTFAMGVVVFCLVAIMGLLTVGLTSNQAAISQSAANTIFSAVISDLRATPVTTTTPTSEQPATSPQFGISIPANTVTTATATTLYFTSDGQGSPTPGAQYVYLLTITFLPNGTSPRTATFADLTITWPAAAVPHYVPGSVVPQNVLGSVETFVALDRN